MDEASQILIILVPGLFIAVATSIITVRLSLRQFYSERWWERKATAYSEIIESLYRMRVYIEGLRDSEEQGKELPEEVKRDLQARAREGRDKLSRAAEIGAFVISDDAAECLRRLHRHLQTSVPEGSFFDYLEGHSEELHSYLDEMRSIAKADLNVD
ncbi:MAG: hypothetical protein IH953_00510 [Chloroflexi bacterium]|nr:hypothetical protein [Chloroflexota bacterium]